MSEQNIDERACVESLLAKLGNQLKHDFLSSLEQNTPPPSQGVYLIRGRDDAVLHVGRTVSGQRGLAQRLKNHLSGRSSFVRAYLNGNAKLLLDGYKFQYIEVENDRTRALLEYRAIAWYCPAHLGLGRKNLLDDVSRN